jgi:hypothetical protein
VTAAEDAGFGNPGVGEKFRLPAPARQTPHSGRSPASCSKRGRANQELLAKHGLSTTMLAELESGIKAFDTSLQESDGSKQTHVAARAKMKALGDELMRLVGIPDGFNRYRFHHGPELIAAWESAKHRVSGPAVKEEVPAPSGPVTPGLEPAA